MSNIDIQIPEKLLFFLQEPKRYKVAYGGRGSGKSYNIGIMLILKMMQSPVRILCTRQLQTSIRDSVHKLLSDIIEKYKLLPYFTITRDGIRCYNGGEFLFRGIQNNINEIKSMEGVDICWCFPAGTKVDGKNIESIKQGDYVYSFNHFTNTLEKRQVLRVMKRKIPNKLYKVLTHDGSKCIISTSEHPYYVKDKGYVPAKELKVGDIVYEKIRLTDEMSMFRWMWGRNRIRYSRKKTEVCKKRRNLLSRLCSETQLRKNEKTQSYGQCRNQIENDKGYSIARTQTNCNRWQWQRLYRTTKNTSEKTRSWMVDGIINTNRTRKGRKQLADKLQSGLSQYLLWNSNRNRWFDTSWKDSTRRRQEKDYVLTEQRVDNIEILESSSIKGLGLSDGGNYVYNLEVQGNNNYFANGLLVHNCEEAQNISQESWDILIPTIRKEQSEIWVSFNPDREEDATYKMFVKDKRDDCHSELVNYVDNPFFPETLQREMEYCKKVDFGKYENVWLGKTTINTEAQVFNGKFELKDFDTPDDARFFYGADWGFACLKGDTLIKTINGDVPIRDVKVGDLVLTRQGYKRVIHNINKGYKKVYELDYGYKKSIIATGDHRIFTYDGWKRVDELKDKEELCVIKSNLMVELIKGIQKVSTRITSIINGKKTVNTIKESCIGIFGNIIKGLFQRAISYTTKTIIHSITVLKILYVLLQKNIQKYITKIISELLQKKEQKISEQRTDTQKKTGLKEERSQSQQFNLKEEYAKNVENLSQSLMSIKNSVVRIVERGLIQGIAKKSMYVKSVVKGLWQRLISTERLARKNVHINLQQLTDKEEVFDLTIEESHEYFANGILVHNCDPTTLIRCFIQDRCLYIDYEAYGVGVELDEIPQLFDSVPDSRKWKILADCARPETVSHIKNKGFDIESCPKWKGSVEDGVEYIRSFERVYIHSRCPHTYYEFKFYSYKQDKNTGEVLPILLDKDNHCLVAGTMITTNKGQIPIENIKVGDKVLTRQGYKKVLWSGVSDTNRQVYKVQTDKGNYIIGTDNHRILTTRGFCDIDSIRYGDKVLIGGTQCNQTESQCMELNGIDTQTQKGEVIENIINTAIYIFTIIFGNKFMARGKRAITSIIKMVIHKIIQLRIWKKLQSKNIVLNILAVKKLKKNIEVLWKKTTTSKIGIKANKVLSGIKNTLKNKISEYLIYQKEYATVVENNSNQKSITKDFALTNAKVLGEEDKDLITLLSIANGVDVNSKLININKNDFVVGNVVAITEESIADKVYDLTVEEQHEFFANGILVHNCIDGLRYALNSYIQKDISILDVL